MEPTLTNLITIIGMPSIFSIVVYLIRALKKYRDDSRAKEAALDVKIEMLMSAYQMQMRRDLYRSYREYMKNGWIEVEDLETWESQYQAYHKLGKNGVMDSKRAELMALPSTKPKKATTRSSKVKKEATI